MANLIDYFNSGAIYENTGHVTYLTSKLSDIQEKIIPPFFFLDPKKKKLDPLQGYKFSDYKKFGSVAELMEKKKKAPQEGLEEIIKIKKKKNR